MPSTNVKWLGNHPHYKRNYMREWKKNNEERYKQNHYSRLD